MTFKLKKTELFKALLVVLCALAIAFAVVLLLPRGAASADEIDGETPYTVTWEYQAFETGEWQSFVNGATLFTYEENADYSGRVRAKVEIGDADAVYAYNNADEMHLTYSGTFNEASYNTLVNATEYTVIIDGVDDIADLDKTIKIKIAPAVFELNESDFIDYGGGEGDQNRLWLLGDGDAATALYDTVTYYDPDAEFHNVYGAKVTEGVLYNSYAYYTGNAQKVTLNGDYIIESNRSTLSNYLPMIKRIAYTHNGGDAAVAGQADAVNKITTEAVITLEDNWVMENGAKSATLTKEWYIVTLVNGFKSLDGSDTTAVEGWTYGGEVPALSIRPEYGDTAVLTLYKGQEVVDCFAVKYSGQGGDVTLGYYGVKSQGGQYVLDDTKALSDDYYTQVLGSLAVDRYSLNLSVPACTDESGVAYCSVSRAYDFAVAAYEFNAEDVSLIEGDSTNIIVKLLSDQVSYNALENNLPEIEVTFRGVKLEAGVDYELISHNVTVGKASFTLLGRGSFEGGFAQFDDTYEIVPAVNTWKDMPSIVYWTYGGYDKQMNLITAAPTYLDNQNDISFKVTTDMYGEQPAAKQLDYFLLTDGLVSDEVATSLNALPVGTYYLFATVKESTNYKALAPRSVTFKVFPAGNSWQVTPSISTWTEGKFKSSINLPVATPLFGNATIVIKDSNGKDVYSNVTGVNKLSTAKAGVYTLTAIVISSNDYYGLEYSTVFTVHEKPGIPVWATVLIVLGSLLAVAIIIFVLIKTGVLRILTAKLMVSIRTQAAVDATVAAVRASERNYAYKQQMDEKKQTAAKRKEQSEARKAKAEQEKALPVEQKIAALEEKARKAEARAEKMKARAEAIQQRADRMKETAVPQQPAEQPADEPATEAAATANETPAED